MPADLPDPRTVFPIPNLDSVQYVKPTIKNPNILVGDFTYFSGGDFEKQVTHFYPDFYGDRLIIGKFCQIAAGVEFMMNGANHQMNSASTFPFYIFEKWNDTVPPLEAMPMKGDTIIGNDVWIGQDALILPGAKIGDGVIIGAGSVVGGTIKPYSIAAGNPAKFIRKRFDDELVTLLLQFRWWDLPIPKIMELIPMLHSADLAYVKEKLRELLSNSGV
jgi:virginiamycin A acetyltransferase